jgi:Sulfatase
LLAYLCANGFQTWICSGGTVDFMRVFAAQVYGIPAERIIGSVLKRDSRMLNGRRVIWQLPEIDSINDKEVKPVNIDRQIGRRPIFAGGNVGNAGDIAMIEYSKGRTGPSFQLLINHDDEAREFAYAEKDNFSLDAAKKNSFTVVNIKSDWMTFFGRGESRCCKVKEATTTRQAPACRLSQTFYSTSASKFNGGYMKQDRPNIVFIVGDNVGWGDISCYGGLAPTPRIDALAGQGMRFKKPQRRGPVHADALGAPDRPSADSNRQLQCAAAGAGPLRSRSLGIHARRRLAASTASTWLLAVSSTTGRRSPPIPGCRWIFI